MCVGYAKFTEIPKHEWQAAAILDTSLFLHVSLDAVGYNPRAMTVTGILLVANISFHSTCRWV